MIVFSCISFYVICNRVNGIKRYSALPNFSFPVLRFYFIKLRYLSFFITEKGLFYVLKQQDRKKVPLFGGKKT